MIRKTLLAAALALATCSASAANITLQDKIALQATMAAYIESHSVGGIVPHVRLDTGETVNLSPAKAHPMILQMGDQYVLCTDFRDPHGNFVNIDFYVARRGGEFVVFQTEVDNRGPLKALVQDGKVQMLD
ncbi:MAG: hypothetical protein H6878_02620 [Rhodobiaceae bacterium]|nr:hypothetical protein [Rhodobiaceae bacterium]MCC0015178.1 hypothetical protein [Rhodobiaceae bacterium]MCC0040754.1 hypothetical protein [Rhodobiaceae bacterium]MCC0053581.1 hypothetical protein [Rhodobiaceae bacterium]